MSDKSVVNDSARQNIYLLEILLLMSRSNLIDDHNLQYNKYLSEQKVDWKGGIEQTNSWMSKVTFMFLANTNLTILMLPSNHHTMTTGFDSQPWPICRYECQVDSSLQTLQRFQRKLDVRHFLGRIVWE